MWTLEGSEADVWLRIWTYLQSSWKQHAKICQIYPNFNRSKSFWIHYVWPFHDRTPERMLWCNKWSGMFGSPLNGWPWRPHSNSCCWWFHVCCWDSSMIPPSKNNDFPVATCFIGLFYWQRPFSFFTEFPRGFSSKSRNWWFFARSYVPVKWQSSYLNKNNKDG